MEQEPRVNVETLVPSTSRRISGAFVESRVEEKGAFSVSRDRRDNVTTILSFTLTPGFLNRRDLVDSDKQWRGGG